MAEMLTILARKYFNQFRHGSVFTDNTTDVTHYLMGDVGMVLQRETSLRIYFIVYASSTYEFDIATDSVTRSDGVSWIDEGWVVGDKLAISGTWGSVLHSNVEMEVTNVTDDVIYFTPVGYGYAETGNSTDAYIRLATSFTHWNYYSNFIENDEGINYISKIDNTSIRQWKCQLTPAEITGGTEVSGTQVGSSLSWRTAYDTFTIQCTQEAGSGNDYVSLWTIKETFLLTPLFDTIVNISDTPTIYPNFYSGDSCLRYICKIEPTLGWAPDSSKDFVDSRAPMTYGDTGYYDEVLNQHIDDDFSLNSCSLSVSGNTVTQIDIQDTTDFEIVIDSSQSSFLSTSVFQLQILHLNESISLTDSFATNYTYDRVIGVCDGTVYAGDNSIFSNVSVAAVAGAITITGSIDYTPTQQTAILGGKYMLSVIVSDFAELNQEQKYKHIICDINDFYANTDISGLFEVTSLLFHEHPFLLADGKGRTDYRGWIEDGVLAEGYFTIDTENSATIDTLNVKIEAINSSTGDSFELENYAFDFSSYPVNSGVQEIAIDTTRGFRLATANQFNFVKLNRYSSGDVGYYKKAYQLLYGFKLAWMDYLSDQNVDPTFYDATKLNDGLNKDWVNFWSGDWEVKMTLTAVCSQGGVETTYYVDSPKIQLYDYDLDENAYPAWTGSIECFDDEAETTSLGTDNFVILKTSNCKLVATFISTDPLTTSSVYGIIEIEEYQNGGLFAKHQLSSEYPPHHDCPLIPLTGELYAKVTVVDLNTVTIECLIDKNKISEGASYQFSARIGTACVDGVGVVACDTESTSVDSQSNCTSVTITLPDVAPIVVAGPTTGALMAASILASGTAYTFSYWQVSKIMVYQFCAPTEGSSYNGDVITMFFDIPSGDVTITFTLQGGEDVGDCLPLTGNYILMEDGRLIKLEDDSGYILRES